MRTAGPRVVPVGGLRRRAGRRGRRRTARLRRPRRLHPHRRRWPSGWYSSGRRFPPWSSGPTWSGARATPSSSAGSSTGPVRVGWRCPTTGGHWSTPRSWTTRRRPSWPRSTAPATRRRRWGGRGWSPATTPARWPNWSRASCRPPGCDSRSARCRLPWPHSPAGWSGGSGRAMNRPSPISRPGSSRWPTGSTRPATQRVLRWRPQVGVDEGLARLAASYAAH